MLRPCVSPFRLCAPLLSIRVSTAAIEAVDLAKSYGEVQALKGVSFEVARGEIFGFLGRNGAGKSTAVRILTTLLRPTSGQARVLGIDVEAHRAKVRRVLGVTLQEAALDDLMTGREHLLLAGRLCGLTKARARDRADQLLESFGLASAADRIAARYSGGMRRRLDVAMALVREPQVLFLDEPTTGLDPQSRRALWMRIRELRDRGAAVFLTTQYIAEAEELASRVAIVHDGRLAAVDGVEALKRRCGTTVVKLHWAGGQAPAAARFAPLDGLTVSEGDDGWMQVAVDGGEPEVPAVVARLAPLGGAIERLVVEGPSLEEVFVSLTGSGIDSNAGSNDSQSFSAVRRGMGFSSTRGA